MSNNGFPTAKGKITTYVNLDKDLILSPADMGNTVVIGATNDYSILLPDARLLIQNLISIKNNNSTGIGILDNNGLRVATIGGGESCILICSDKTTSSGNWNLNIVGVNRSSFSASSWSSVNAVVSGNGSSICMLTESTGVVLYVNGNLYTTTFSIINGTIVLGLSVTSGISGSQTCMFRLSPNKALVVTGGASPTGNAQCWIITLTGTTLSFSTPVTINSINTSYIKGCLIDANKVAIIYTAASGGYAYSQIITVSGSTISYGSAITIYSGITTGISICKISKYLCAVSYSPSTSNLYAATVGISGNVMTLNTATSVATLANGVSGSSIAYLKNGILGVLFANAYAVGIKIATVSILGTTLTYLNTVVLDSVSHSAAGYVKLVSINKNTSIAIYLKSTSYLNFRKLNILPGNTLSADTETQIGTTTVIGLDSATCQGTLFIPTVFADNSTGMKISLLTFT
jgi:hypothetical protein